ncbi:DUF420 domain-containing protein [bacterium]|nr:MAG: DUF420 domain-containing protein [bacterium]
MNGFLGTGAPFLSDLNLTIQLLMGVALLIGMVLARRGHYRAHAICQGSVMLLNLVMIALIMLPSFRLGVLPGLPGELGKPYYSVATLHASLGATAQLLGLYILLRAGTNLLPQLLRFQNYQLWMRTELTLWWAVILLGVATYYVWL